MYLTENRLYATKGEPRRDSRSGGYRMPAGSRISNVLAEAGLEILNDVVLNQVLVSAGRDETTRHLIASIQTDGTLLV